MDGKIIRWYDEKNFGFIKGDDGKEYFFHISACEDRDRIGQGKAVMFDESRSEKGLRAENVIVL